MTTVELQQIGKNAHFKGINMGGQSLEMHVPMDSEDKLAPGPMETLLLAICGCSSYDVIAILKKMKQPLEDLRVTAKGEKHEKGNANPYKNIHLTFYLKGAINEKKANKATQLAVEKYCSVRESIDPAIVLTWEVIIE